MPTSVREDVKGYRASGKTENYDAEPGLAAAGSEGGREATSRIAFFECQTTIFPLYWLACQQAGHKLCPPSETTINYASSRSSPLPSKSLNCSPSETTLKDNPVAGSGNVS